MENVSANPWLVALGVLDVRVRGLWVTTQETHHFIMSYLGIAAILCQTDVVFTQVGHILPYCIVWYVVAAPPPYAPHSIPPHHARPHPVIEHHVPRARQYKNFYVRTCNYMTCIWSTSCPAVAQQ